MRVRQLPSVVLLSTMLLAFLQAGGARAQCDSSYVSLSDGRRVTGTDAAQEQVYADSMHRQYPDSSYVADGSGYVRVALAARRFEAASHSEQPFYFYGSARDEYRVAGAPSGTEVTFRVRLVGVIEFVFYEHCGGSGCNPVAALEIEGAPSEHLEMVGVGSFFDQVLPFDRSMSLTRRADEMFMLDYYLTAGTSHSPAYVSLSARVSFEDLPPGMSVVSCLEEFAPTNSRVGTWGSLKVRYR